MVEFTISSSAAVSPGITFGSVKKENLTQSTGLECLTQDQVARRDAGVIGMDR